VVEEGGFLYDADSYADDLPYWVHDYGLPHLVIPYTLDNNDMRFTNQGLILAINSLPTYAMPLMFSMPKAKRTKMMSVGLHCRLVGRPGRAASLVRFWTMCRNMSGCGYVVGLILRHLSIISRNLLDKALNGISNNSMSNND